MIKIPWREAPPIPAKNPSGTEITIAHGQEITRNVNALLNQILKPPLKIIGGIIASRIAKITTAGV